MKNLKIIAPLLVVIFVSSSCSEDDDSPAQTAQSNCQQYGATASAITNNTDDSHSLTISAADINAGTEKTYTIDGTAGHSQSVTVTASDFTTLQAGTAITKTATSGSGGTHFLPHDHSVTISCSTAFTFIESHLHEHE